MAYDGYMIVFYCAVALNYSNEAVAYRNSGSGLCGGGYKLSAKDHIH